MAKSKKIMASVNGERDLDLTELVAFAARKPTKQMERILPGHDWSKITGAMIKARIPGYDPSYSLLLLREGESDQLITDSTVIKIVDGMRFCLLPPALGS